MTVVVFEVSTDCGLQFASAAMHPAPQLFFGEQGEQALDQIEPPRTALNMHAGKAGEVNRLAITNQLRAV